MAPRMGGSSFLQTVVLLKVIFLCAFYSSNWVHPLLGDRFFSFSPASWTANAMLVLQSGLLALGVTFPALFPGESDAGVPCLHTLG